MVLASRALLEQNSCANLARASWLRISDAKEVLGIIDAVLGNQFAAAYTCDLVPPAAGVYQPRELVVPDGPGVPRARAIRRYGQDHGLLHARHVSYVRHLCRRRLPLGPRRVKSHQHDFKHAEVAKVGEVAKAASAPAVSVSHL